MDDKIKVGDTLYVFPNRYNHRGKVVRCTTATVQKIGRRWITTDRGRFDKDSLAEDAGQYASTHRGYRAPEDYWDEVLARTLIVSLRDRLTRTDAEDVSVTRIKQAMDLLGLDYTDELAKVAQMKDEANGSA